MTHTLPPLDYFKLKAALLEILLAEQQLGAAKAAAFAAAGLPTGAYTFDDATCAVLAPDPPDEAPDAS